MKLLFTHAYFLHLDKKQLEQSKPYPPLGTIQAAAYLRENGFEVSLYDTQFDKTPTGVSTAIEKDKPDVLVIYEDGFNYLTKMCLTNMREATFEMIKLAKEFDIHVIVSGSDSTDHYEKYLNVGCDEVILGEAEETLLQLTKALKNNKALNSISGIVFKENGSPVRTEAREILTALDNLPLPAWDLVDIEPYKKAWSRHGYFSVNLATTRGCPYKCNWCAKPIYGYRYNSRSPEHVIREIKLVQSLFAFDYIWFCDDIFGLKPHWVKNFNRLLKQEAIEIKYKIQSRADLLTDEQTVIDLAQSGCDEVWIGAESGSQKILDAMEKGSTVAQIEKSTLLMQKHGIKPCFFLQFGYLDENWDDIQATLSMVFRLMPHDIGVSVSYPLPGTKFHAKVKSQLEQKANWTDSDELLLMYKNTYSPAFYKKLHRFIHKRFRQRQAFQAIKKVRLKMMLRWAYFFVMSRVNYVQLLFLKKEV